MNKLYDNISSDGSVSFSVSFQKENFELHKVDDDFDNKKRIFLKDNKIDFQNLKLNQNL